jgi:cytochrome c556
MKKNLTFALITLITLGLIFACGKNSTPSNKDNKDQPLNPNGDSELAIVMRTMMQSGKTMKAEIEKGGTLSPYPAEIKTITTAKPTDGMIEDRNVFNGLANYYLATLDSVYMEATDTKKQFNHLVKSCVDCHQNYCQGPIPAIQQLYISSK